MKRGSIFQFFCECGKKVECEGSEGECPHCHRLLSVDMTHVRTVERPPAWIVAAAAAVALNA